MGNEATRFEKITTSAEIAVGILWGAAGSGEMPLLNLRLEKNGREIVGTLLTLAEVRNVIHLLGSAEAAMADAP